MTYIPTWNTQVEKPLDVADVSDDFLSEIASQLDEEDVRSIILKGSCARKEETLYSDVDLTLLVHNDPSRSFYRFYSKERLISVSSHTVAYYRKCFQQPQKAIFVVPGIREAKALLDKDGAFQQLQQEALNWQWEPLQHSANSYAVDVLLELTEIIHKALRAFLVRDEFALGEMILIIADSVSTTISVQRGILAASGNSYFRQLQESVGFSSMWTRYHRFVVGIDGVSLGLGSGLESRGMASLRLYQETIKLLRPNLSLLASWDVIEHTAEVIEKALSDKQVF